MLLCLVNMVFERPAHDRQIAFSDIAHRTRIPLGQVEWVLMRAMSLGLVRGALDEVDGVVSVTWVQPRVLDKRQLAMLCDQLGGWGERYECFCCCVHFAQCVYLFFRFTSRVQG